VVVGALTLLAAAPPAGASIFGGAWLFARGSGQVVADLSGNNLAATLGSTPVADANDPAWVAHDFGFLPALRFNGSQYLTVPDAPSLDSAQVTVGAIVRANGSPGAYSYIAAKGAFACQAASYGLYTGPTGGLAFYVSNGATSYTLSPDAGAGVWDGKWHLVVGTFDGSTVRLYVDGHQVGTGSPSTITIQYGLPDTNQFTIGDYLGPCPAPLGFVGDIEGVAVLNAVTQSPLG
jgi:hypothetical protein